MKKIFWTIISITTLLIVLVDVTAYHRGYHGDLNETLFVGQVSETAKKLVQVTWECLEKAIEIGKSSATLFFFCCC